MKLRGTGKAPKPIMGYELIVVNKPYEETLYVAKYHLNGKIDWRNENRDGKHGHKPIWLFEDTVDLTYQTWELKPILDCCVWVKGNQLPIAQENTILISMNDEQDTYTHIPIVFTGETELNWGITAYELERVEYWMWISNPKRK